MAPNTKETGNWGEEVASQLLIQQGCAILARQWKMGHYEIDIIAQKGSEIIFVEVKTRKAGQTDPVDAVNPRKRSRMVASANVYMQSITEPFEYRFDIIAVTGSPDNYEVEHIPDAFVPGIKRFNFSFRL